MLSFELRQLTTQLLPVAQINTSATFASLYASDSALSTTFATGVVHQGYEVESRWSLQMVFCIRLESGTV